MTTDRPVVIIGPGATGGLLAATLVRAGVPVSLLCRDAARARRLRRDGIRISGATTLKVSGSRFLGVAHEPGRLGPARAVFVCVKSYDAAAAIRAARALTPGCEAVVSLLNGLSHVAPFRRAIPSRAAVYGVGYFSAFRTGPGRVRHAGGDRILLASDPPLPMGEGRVRGRASGAEAARRLLEQAGWKVAVTAFVDRLLWTKLVLNASINPLAALAGRPNGDLAADPALAELLGRTAAEGQAVMEAGGIRPLESPLPDFAAALCRRTASNVNSMLADVRAGRRTELDAILLPILKGARLRRVPTPVLSSVYSWMRSLESEVRGG